MVSDNDPSVNAPVIWVTIIRKVAKRLERQFKAKIDHIWFLPKRRARIRFKSMTNQKITMDDTTAIRIYKKLDKK